MKHILINQDYLNSIRKLVEHQKLDYLRNKSIFITGASGLIGSCLTDVCLFMNKYHDANIRIIIMGRNKQKLIDRFTPLMDKNLIIFENDMTNPISDSFGKIDYFIHAAGNATPKTISSDHKETLEGTIKGTENTLEFSIKNKVLKYIYVSSGEIYGSLVEDLEFDESSPGAINHLHPRASYPLGKKVAEYLVNLYRENKGLDAIIVRPCHVFGPTAQETDDRAIMDFIYSSIKNDKIVMKSLGTQIRSYCYVMDCISAILYILNLNQHELVYNISYEKDVVSIKELAEMISSFTGSNIEYNIPNADVNSFNLMNRSVLSSKLLYNTGWNNEYTIKEGLRETIKVLNWLMKDK